MSWIANQQNAVWRVVDGEAVIIHSETGAYFSLNRLGTWAWEVLAAGPLDEERLAAGLAHGAGRQAETAAEEARAFFLSLREAGLVVPAPGGTPTVAELPAPPDDTSEPPLLVRFGDLETLILSGE